ncbi:Carbon-monoxide dehydrogenase (Acceptor) [Frankia sp. Hr75.2]|nr:Carbon-monoxide dehydrogenase (Acceptor) [Frankia sp. Hr75.2]
MRETTAARYAGTRVQRVEDGRLLTGHGTFVDDVRRPGMLHTCFVRSPFAHARVTHVDISAALDLPGVHAVFLAADLNPDIREQWYTSMGKDIPDTPRPALASDEVRFVGDPVALVIAESRYIAEDATELVEVDYDPLPAVADYRDAETADALVHEAYPGNVAGRMGGPPPAAAEEVFAAAAHVADETIYQQGYAAVPIETRGLVVEWSAGELTIWAATQAPHEVRAFCARLLGLPEQCVRVIMRDTGGGFGQKVIPLREDMCVMLAARKVPAAIKWIEDRRENLMSAGQADMPYVNPCGMPYDHMSPRETFDLALEMLDYGAFRREQHEARAAGRYLGVGTCSYVEPTSTGMGYYATEGATIRIEPSGAVNVYVAGGSTGNSIETTVVQLTADALGVDLDQVATIQGDTAVTPFGAGTAGSRSGSRSRCCATSSARTSAR